MNSSITRTLLGLTGIGLAFSLNSHGDEALQQRLADLEAKVASLEQNDAQSLRGAWRNGFIFEQPDKAFRLRVGGRMQMDTAFFSADEALDEAKGPFDDGIKFRRARLFLSGTLYDNFEFLTEYDFAGGTQFRTLYMGVKNIPVIGNVRAGHLLEPFGLEEFSSNNHLTLMERGGPTIFSPVRNSGLMVFNHQLEERMTWAAGVFKDTGNFGDSVSNEEFAVTARLTGLPYLANEDRNYLHVGYNMSYRNLNEEGFRARARPDSFVAPYVTDTKNLTADSVTLASLEAMLNLGPLTLQSEWGMAGLSGHKDEDGVGQPQPEFTAYYVMAAYRLTGEHKPYNRKNGTFLGIRPNQNVTGKSWGKGAWELAARYNSVDLMDKNVEGGEMEAVTFGLNWYLNPNSRVMFNYVMADVKDIGDVDVYQMRFQFDF
ncbi:MAG TPA: porin [Kiritimatiellia bacterium]|nr:porin [Kiritimatiellia bacterium]HMO98265.1 porin [Kiritimatiellia bacterium]HMP96262.1 porin [Kiritimatiellia bacterium]